MKSTSASTTLLAAVSFGCALSVIPLIAADDGFKREGKREKKDLLENKPAPALQVANWMNTRDGKALKLDDLKGRVVVLDFWGTW